MTESTYKWSEARDACNKLGGVLAVPHSLEEHRFIGTFTRGHWVWIDCSDQAAKGSWECKEGGVEVSFRKWDRNQPGGEGCAAIILSLGRMNKKYQLLLLPIFKHLLMFV